MLLYYKKSFAKRLALNETIGIKFINDKDYSIFQKEYVRLKPRAKALKLNLLLQDVLTEDDLKEIIYKEHVSKNHRGIDTTYLELKPKYYYPSLKQKICNVLKSCFTCQQAKYDRIPLKIPYETTLTPKKPKEIYHIDLWFPNKQSIYISCIDKFSKYAVFKKIKSRNWPDIKEGLIEILSTMGNPKLIITDNEGGFGAENLKNFLDRQSILLHLITPYNKTSNADIERLHNTINEHLRIINTKPDHEKENVNPVVEALYYYNTLLEKNPFTFTLEISPIEN